MAGNIAAIRAGKASVELFADDSNLARGLKQAEQKIKAFGASVTAAGRTMILWGTAIAAPLAYAVKEWMDAEAELRRFGATFGTQAGMAGLWADEFGKAIGRSRIEVRGVLGDFQQLWMTMGIGTEEGVALSEQITKLAYDFASFENIADTQAVVLFTSALGGNTRGLMRYGINLKEGALSAELLREGIVGGTTAATEGQKAFARMSLIQRALTNDNAIGAAAQDTFANSLKRFRAVADDTWRLIGRQLAPALKDWMNTGAKILLQLQKWASANAGLIVLLAKTAGALVALGTAGLVIGGIAKSVAGLTLVVGGLRKAFVATTAAMKAMALAGTVIPAIPMAGAAGAGAIGIPGKVGGAAVGAAAAGGSAALMGASAAKLTVLGPAGVGAAVAIPILAALAAATYLVGSAMEKAGTQANNLSDEFSKQYEAGRLADAGARETMARLAQLAAQNELTNDEWREASKLIGGIQAEYGDLGLSVDTVTGKINGMTEAQVALNKALAERGMMQAKNQIEEARGAIDKLKAQIEYLSSKRHAFWWGMGNVFTLNWGAEDKEMQTAIKESQAQLDIWNAKLFAAKRLLVALGITAPEIKPPGAGPAKDALKQAKDSADALAEFRIQNQNIEFKNFQRKNKAEYDKAIELIDFKTQKALEAARELGATQEGIDNIHKLAAEEAAKAGADFNERAAKHEDELFKKEEDHRHTIAELELETTLKGTALEHAKLDLQEKWALAAAAANGENLDAVRREFELRNQLVDLQKGVEQKLSVRGTFSGEATWGMTTGDEGKQMIEALRQIEKNTGKAANKSYRFG